MSVSTLNLAKADIHVFNFRFILSCPGLKGKNAWLRPNCSPESGNPGRLENTFDEFWFTISQTLCIGSGRVFSGSGIWPKYGAGFGKMQNILTGFGIWLLPGKRDSPNFEHGMGDFFACLSNSGNRYDPRKRSSGKSESTRRAQNTNRKGQSTC